MSKYSTGLLSTTEELAKAQKSTCTFEQQSSYLLEGLEVSADLFDELLDLSGASCFLKQTVKIQ